MISFFLLINNRLTPIPTLSFLIHSIILIIIHFLLFLLFLFFLFLDMPLPPAILQNSSNNPLAISCHSRNFQYKFSPGANFAPIIDNLYPFMLGYRLIYNGDRLNLRLNLSLRFGFGFGLRD